MSTRPEPPPPDEPPARAEAGPPGLPWEAPPAEAERAELELWEPGPADLEPWRRRDDLQPGQGRPEAEGPPASVGPPIPARVFNRAALIAAVAIGAVTLVIVLLLVLALLGIVIRL